MEVLRGNTLEDFPLAGLQKVGDLIYFEGPLLSLFQDQNGRYYIFYWCDTDSEVNRWLVFPVSRADLQAYLDKKKPLRNLLLNSGADPVLAVDIDGALEYKHSVSIHPLELPESYVPGGDSWWDDSLTSQAERDVLVAVLRARMFGPTALDRLQEFLQGALTYPLALPARAFGTKRPKAAESSDGDFAYHISEGEGGTIIVRLDAKWTELVGKSVRLYSEPPGWERVGVIEEDVAGGGWVYLEVRISREERETLPEGAVLRADLLP